MDVKSANHHSLLDSEHFYFSLVCMRQSTHNKKNKENIRHEMKHTNFVNTCTTRIFRGKEGPVVVVNV